MTPADTRSTDPRTIRLTLLLGLFLILGACLWGLWGVTGGYASSASLTSPDPVDPGAVWAPTTTPEQACTPSSDVAMALPHNIRPDDPVAADAAAQPVSTLELVPPTTAPPAAPADTLAATWGLASTPPVAATATEVNVLVSYRYCAADLTPDRILLPVVHETPNAVTITFYALPPASSPRTARPAARAVPIAVHLTSPVGQRPIYDGADTDLPRSEPPNG